MSNYKITNITNSLGKRDLMYNSSVDVEYVSGLDKIKYILQPNETLYLKIDSLPLSVHKLRMKKFVIVSEIDSQTMASEYNKKNIKPINPIILPVKDIKIENIEDNNIAESKKTKKNTKHTD